MHDGREADASCSALLFLLLFAEYDLVYRAF